MFRTDPIGIFDSGVGGISIMSEIRKLLPGEHLLYFADSAYCPYGVKAPDLIRQRIFGICEFLLGLRAKLIVVACNTASIAGLDALREHFAVPIVGVEPAVKPAAATTKNGKVGLLATGVTIAGQRFSSLLERFGDGVEILTQPAPGLVELVEAGQLSGPTVEEMLGRYLDPLLSHGVDTIVLGCTHYPFLKPLVEKLAGPDIQVLETGTAVARQAVRMMAGNNLANLAKRPGQEKFFTSGAVSAVEPVIRLLWGNEELKVTHAETGVTDYAG